MGRNILIIEDEIRIRILLRDYLKKEGFNVIEASDGDEGINTFQNNSIDLILLDIMMPRVDGITVLETIRNVSDVPIILLTAKSQEEDKLFGYELGADDYITKPFNPLEMIARVKSQLRRYTMLGNFGASQQREESNSIIGSGGLSLNIDTKEVIVDGEVIKVTATELGILELLLRNQGRVFSIDEIYEKVWKEPSYNAENTVAVHIRRIREKIEINPKDPKYLKVVWGIGYKIEKY
ncbi:response regulator transcription factor [Clostridium saudiense]|nr:response regulator transcription factor [Clostridium saudiense]